MLDSARRGRRRGATRESYTLERAVRRARATEPDPHCRRRCTSGAPTTTSGGCMTEVSEICRQRAIGTHDRRRGARIPTLVSAALRELRSRRPAERLPRAWPQDPARLRVRPLRRHRRRHELGQASRGRAPPRRPLAHDRRPCRGDEARRGPARVRAAPAGADRPDGRRRSSAWSTSPAAPEPPRSQPSRPRECDIAEQLRRARSMPCSERCGVGIEIISGEEEARLAYVAATSELDLGKGTLVVFDTGGGSTEFTFGRAGRVEERFSLDVGAAAVHRALRPRRAGLGRAAPAAFAAIAASSAGSTDGGPRPHSSAWVARSRISRPSSTASTRTTPRSSTAPCSIGARSTARSTSTAHAPPTSGARSSACSPARAEVILAGACIVRTVLDKLDCDELTVSDRSLRHGLLVERFAAARQAP